MKTNNNDLDFVKKKIYELAYLHGVRVKKTTGHNIDLQKEKDRLLEEYQNGDITVSDILEDISEYMTLRRM